MAFMEENKIDQLNVEEKSILLYMLSEAFADTNIICQELRKMRHQIDESVSNFLICCNQQNFSVINGGSRTEGCSLTSVLPSDCTEAIVGDDSMLVPQGVLILPYSGKDRFQNYQDVDIFYEMFSSSTRELNKPGYTKLRYAHLNEIALLNKPPSRSSHISFLLSCSERDEHGDLYLSSEKVRNSWIEDTQTCTNLKNIINSTKEQGGNKDQSNSVLSQSQDTTFKQCAMISLRCEEYPAYVYDWLDRASARKWPGRELCSKIINQGCHFVPIGNPLSDDYEVEWRISFTYAERILLSSFNPTQTKCLLILKLLINYYLKPYFPGTLDSYHVKTLLFWELEFNESISWTPENIYICLISLLRRLLRWIGLEICEHYFLPKNNIFERKIGRANKVDIIRIINDIHSNLTYRCCQIPLINLTIPQWKEGMSFELLQQTNILKEKAIQNAKYQMQRELISSIYLNMHNTFSSIYTFQEDSNLVQNISTQQQLFLNRIQFFLNSDAKNCFGKNPVENSNIHKIVHDKIEKYLIVWYCGVLLATQDNTEQMLQKHPGKSAREVLLSVCEHTPVDGYITLALHYIHTEETKEALTALTAATNMFNEGHKISNVTCELCECSSEQKHDISDENPLSIVNEWIENKIMYSVTLNSLMLPILPRFLQFVVIQRHRRGIATPAACSNHYAEPDTIIALCEFLCYYKNDDKEKCKEISGRLSEMCAWEMASFCFLMTNDTQNAVKNCILAIMCNICNLDNLFASNLLLHILENLKIEGAKN